MRFCKLKVRTMRTLHNFLYAYLFQLQFNDNSQPIWSEILFESAKPNTSDEEDEEAQAFHIKSGTVSNDGR
jgi:hypothetical protein